MRLDRYFLPVGGPAVSSGAARARASASPGVPARAHPAILEELERSHLLSVLEQTGGAIEWARGAAKILDLHPNTLRSRMKRLGLPRRSPRDS